MVNFESVHKEDLKGSSSDTEGNSSDEEISFDATDPELEKAIDKFFESDDDFGDDEDDPTGPYADIETGSSDGDEQSDTKMTNPHGDSQSPVMTREVAEEAEAENVHETVSLEGLSDQEIQEKIDQSLDKIRPYLNMDGGDVEFVSYDKESGIVSLRLQGTCGHCAISSVTMKMGVEQTLIEDIPEIKGVAEVE